MSSYASTSTHTRAVASDLDLVVGSAMYPIGQEQLQYDARGRLMPFVETQAQRRERERLLKRKRVNKWLEESTMEAAKVRSGAARGFHLGDRPDSIAEEDEEEPYVLYSTSPSSASSPLSASPLYDASDDSGSLKSSSRKGSRSSLGSEGSSED